MPKKTQEEWREFMRDWLRILSEGNPGEAKVEDITREIFQELGWHSLHEVHSEVQLPIPCGTKIYSVRADFVLAESAKDSSTPGKPYAVVELKNPGTHLQRHSLLKHEESKSGKVHHDPTAQARSYAAYLRTPVYAVYNGERLSIYSRNCNIPDQELLSISHHDVDHSLHSITDLLGKSQLIDQCQKLRSSELNGNKQLLSTILRNQTSPVSSLDLFYSDNAIFCEKTPEDIIKNILHSSHPTHLRIFPTNPRTEQSPPVEIKYLCLQLLINRQTTRIYSEDPGRWIRELEKLQPLTKALTHPIIIETTKRIVGLSSTDALPSAPPPLQRELNTETIRNALFEDFIHKIKTENLGAFHSENRVHWNHENILNSVRTSEFVDLEKIACKQARQRFIKSLISTGTTSKDRLHQEIRCGATSVSEVSEACLFIACLAFVFNGALPDPLTSTHNLVLEGGAIKAHCFALSGFKHDSDFEETLPSAGVGNQAQILLLPNANQPINYLDGPQRKIGEAYPGCDVNLNELLNWRTTIGSAPRPLCLTLCRDLKRTLREHGIIHLRHEIIRKMQETISGGHSA